MKPKEREAWALNAVRKKYESEGYIVSKSKVRGADLQVTREDEILFLEIKGWKKPWGHLDLTEREFERLLSDPNFRLVEVNEVNGEPQIKVWTKKNIKKTRIELKIRVWLE